MIEHQIQIDTPSGPVGTFVCHPERGGPHPVIFFFMDAPGIREELRDMVRRLAATGYYVLLPNLYHRAGVEEFGNFIGQAGSAERAKFMKLMSELTMPMVMEDADALLAFANADPAASKGPIGCLGYCMSGQYAIAAAARFADRVKAAASIYGVRLMTEAADSPHKLALGMPAALYIAWAETDHYAPIETLEPLRQALAGRANTEIELYRGVEHGFAFPQRPAYNRAAAERHWERLFALFGSTLRRN